MHSLKQDIIQKEAWRNTSASGMLYFSVKTLSRGQNLKLLMCRSSPCLLKKSLQNLPFPEIFLGILPNSSMKRAKWSSSLWHRQTVLFSGRQASVGPKHSIIFMERSDTKSHCGSVPTQWIGLDRIKNGSPHTCHNLCRCVDQKASRLWPAQRSCMQVTTCLPGWNIVPQAGPAEQNQLGVGQREAHESTWPAGVHHT